MMNCRKHENNGVHWYGMGYASRYFWLLLVPRSSSAISYTYLLFQLCRKICKQINIILHHFSIDQMTTK